MAMSHRNAGKCSRLDLLPSPSEEFHSPACWDFQKEIKQRICNFTQSSSSETQRPDQTNFFCWPGWLVCRFGWRVASARLLPPGCRLKGPGILGLTFALKFGPFVVAFYRSPRPLAVSVEFQTFARAVVGSCPEKKKSKTKVVKSIEGLRSAFPSTTRIAKRRLKSEKRAEIAA